MAMEQDHRVVLITGGCNGIGLAVGHSFRRAGDTVVLFDHSKPSSQTAVEGMTYVRGDVRRADDVESVVELVIAKYGRLDVLVANAGIFDNYYSLLESSPDDIDSVYHQIMDTNVLGVIHAIRAAHTHLRSANGVILVSSSISGQQAGYGGPLYVASKHALNGLVKSLARQLGPEIRIIGVAPGLVGTSLRENSPVGGSGIGLDRHHLIREATALRRIPDPEDFGALYVSLASPATRTMTGSIVVADSGLQVAAIGDPT